MTVGQLKVAVFRADGSVGLGHGHIFRTLVLAEELRERGWRVMYACRDSVGAPLDRIRGAGFPLELLPDGIDELADAAATARVAREARASWIIVDRYATDQRAHALWRNEGLKVLAIDDLAAHPFSADVLLNQNVNAHELSYRTRGDTVFMFGPHYALVRRIYRQWRPATPRKIETVRRVIVFMGGGDASDATGSVVSALGQVGSQLAVDVVVGAAYPHIEKLLEVATTSPHRVRVLRDIPDLAEPMMLADVAITAGGSASWEFCCMGVPMLLLPIADNQEGIARKLGAIGAAVYLGRVGTIDLASIASATRELVANPQRLTRVASECFSLVDGGGAGRVAERVEAIRAADSVHPGHRIRMRTAGSGDVRVFWEWANEKMVRVNSFCREAIPWEEHVAWFFRKLESPDSLLFVALDMDDVPMGQIRFDLKADEAELHYSLDAKARGKGYGPEIVDRGIAALLEKRAIYRIHALVKSDNDPSIRSLMRAGFKRLPNMVHGGVACAPLVLDIFPAGGEGEFP